MLEGIFISEADGLSSSPFRSLGSETWLWVTTATYVGYVFRGNEFVHSQNQMVKPLRVPICLFEKIQNLVLILHLGRFFDAKSHYLHEAIGLFPRYLRITYHVLGSHCYGRSLVALQDSGGRIAEDLFRKRGHQFEAYASFNSECLRIGVGILQGDDGDPQHLSPRRLLLLELEFLVLGVEENEFRLLILHSNYLI